MLVSPVVSDWRAANINKIEVAKLEALTRYGPKCIGCGDMSSDHLRFYTATTLESVAATYLMTYGLPYQVPDRTHGLSPIVVMCPSCARKARKDRKENPDDVPVRYRYTK